jgi:hypothetical protein
LPLVGFVGTLILFDGAFGNEIENFDVSWGQKKKFFKMGGCRF